MFDIEISSRVLILGFVAFGVMTWLTGMRLAMLFTCALVVIFGLSMNGVDVIEIASDALRRIV